MTFEVEQDELDAATEAVVEAIERQGDRIVAAIMAMTETLVETDTTGVSALIHEFGRITGP